MHGFMSIRPCSDHDSFRCGVQAYYRNVMLVCDNPTEISGVWSVFRQYVHRSCATKFWVYGLCLGNMYTDPARLNFGCIVCV